MTISGFFFNFGGLRQGNGLSNTSPVVPAFQQPQQPVSPVAQIPQQRPQVLQQRPPIPPQQPFVPREPEQPAEAPIQFPEPVQDDAALLAAEQEAIQQQQFLNEFRRLNFGLQPVPQQQELDNNDLELMARGFPQAQEPLLEEEFVIPPGFKIYDAVPLEWRLYYLFLPVCK